VPPADDPRTDAELLRATPQDPDAFAAFYRRHAGWVQRVCVRRCGDPELAADVAADTFAAALAAAGRFDPARGGAGSWLLQIALNKLADAHRRGDAERRAHERAGPPPLAAAGEAARVDELLSLPGAGDAGPLLATLPDEQRRAVEARVVEERGYDEIAAELGLSQAAARQRVSRGLTTLRTRLRRAAGPVPIAVGALLALGGVAAALALSGGRDEPERTPRPPLPATPALPRQCEQVERLGRMTPTAEPVDTELLDDYAIFRRPQRPADRADCPWLPVDVVNPAAIRRLPDDPGGSRSYVVPVPAARDELNDLEGPRICVGTIAPGARRRALGGACRWVEQLRSGDWMVGFGKLDAAGLVPDEVAQIEVRTRRGRVERYPVRDNVWRYRTLRRNSPEAWADRVVELRELDAEGAVLLTRAGDVELPLPPR
jgi:RNA polymerase sigma-70 factor (ECF subfamily)